MAWVSECEVKGLRNIQEISLAGLRRFNIVEGANGAGKTSVLEALHLLGLGRSFRHQKSGPIINYDRQKFTVSGKVYAQQGERLGRSVQVVKSRKTADSFIEIQGNRCLSAAELAGILPLQLIDSDAFELLEGPPNTRRRYLDWGVFHVEHRFLDEWKRCQRVLKQRNNLLRRGKIVPSELEPWDAELVTLVTSISAKRDNYLAQLEPIVQEVLVSLWPEGLGMELSLQVGWDVELSFEEALWRHRDQDILQGYTHVGSHRAELRCRIRGHRVADVLSRGQLKLLASSLKIAQAMHLQQYCGKQCVFLVDDLPAELDMQRREKLCKVLEEVGCQVVITCIDRSAVGLRNVRPEELRVFHVEHGEVGKT